MSTNEVAAAKFLKGQIQQDFLKNVGAGANTRVNSISQQQLGSCIGVFSCIAVSGVGTPDNPEAQEDQIVQNIVANTQPQDLIDTIAQLPEALQVQVVTAYPRQSLAQALEVSQTYFGKLPESTQLVIAGLVKAEAAQVGSCIGVFSCIAVTGAGQASPPPPAPPQNVGGSCIGVFSCIAVSGVGTPNNPNNNNNDNDDPLFHTLPKELKNYLLSFLTPQDAARLSQTARSWHDFILGPVNYLLNNPNKTAECLADLATSGVPESIQIAIVNALPLTFWQNVIAGPTQEGVASLPEATKAAVRRRLAIRSTPQQVGSCIGIFSCIAVSGVGAGNNVVPTDEETIENIVANTQPQDFISAIAQLPEHLQVKVVKEYPPQSLAQALEFSQTEFGQLPEATQLVIAGLVQASLKQVGSCVGLFSCIAVTGAGQAPPQQQVGSACIGLFSCIAVSGVGARPAHINETIRIQGKDREKETVVTGKSGQQAYNQSLVDNVRRGNWRTNGYKDAKGAGKFYNAVARAQDELNNKRSAWNCAEVNAVAQLLDLGSSLEDISLGNPYGENKEEVVCCEACRKWIGELGIKRHFHP